jgi:DUF1365 family protein
MTESIERPHRVSALCYPRICGYVFNPLTLYFCYDKDGQILAIVYEVSSTFGERHSYIIPVSCTEPNTLDKEGAIIHQAVEKRLHVSPFFSMDCCYGFKVQPPADSVMLGIQLNDQEEKLFGAVFKGNRSAIKDRSIVHQLVSLPFQTMKVMAAIHWEALKLYLKGVKVIKHKPAASRYQWSRGEDGFIGNHSGYCSNPTGCNEKNRNQGGTDD